jgi:hypothetical protein
LAECSKPLPLQKVKPSDLHAGRMKMPARASKSRTMCRSDDIRNVFRALFKAEPAGADRAWRYQLMLAVAHTAVCQLRKRLTPLGSAV